MLEKKILKEKHGEGIEDSSLPFDIEELLKDNERKNDKKIRSNENKCESDGFEKKSGVGSANEHQCSSCYEGCVCNSVIKELKIDNERTEGNSQSSKKFAHIINPSSTCVSDSSHNHIQHSALCSPQIESSIRVAGYIWDDNIPLPLYIFLCNPDVYSPFSLYSQLKSERKKMEKSESRDNERLSNKKNNNHIHSHILYPLSSQSFSSRISHSNRRRKLIILLMLFYGASPNSCDYVYGWTPLHVECAKGEYIVVEIMLDPKNTCVDKIERKEDNLKRDVKKKDINLLKDDENSKSEKRGGSEDANTEFTKTRKIRRGDIFVRDRYGMNALHHVCTQTDVRVLESVLGGISLAGSLPNNNNSNGGNKIVDPGGESNADVGKKDCAFNSWLDENDEEIKKLNSKLLKSKEKQKVSLINQISDIRQLKKEKRDEEERIEKAFKSKSKYLLGFYEFQHVPCLLRESLKMLNKHWLSSQETSVSLAKIITPPNKSSTRPSLMSYLETLGMTHLVYRGSNDSRNSSNAKSHSFPISSNKVDYKNSLTTENTTTTDYSHPLLESIPSLGKRNCIHLLAEVGAVDSLMYLLAESEFVSPYAVMQTLLLLASYSSSVESLYFRTAAQNTNLLSVDSIFNSFESCNIFSHSSQSKISSLPKIPDQQTSSNVPDNNNFLNSDGRAGFFNHIPRYLPSPLLSPPFVNSVSSLLITHPLLHQETFPIYTNPVFISPSSFFVSSHVVPSHFSRGFSLFFMSNWLHFLFSVYDSVIYNAGYHLLPLLSFNLLDLQLFNYSSEISSELLTTTSFNTVSTISLTFSNSFDNFSSSETIPTGVRPFSHPITYNSVSLHTELAESVDIAGLGGSETPFMTAIRCSQLAAAFVILSYGGRCVLFSHLPRFFRIGGEEKVENVNVATNVINKRREMSNLLSPHARDISYNAYSPLDPSNLCQIDFSLHDNIFTYDFLSPSSCVDLIPCCEISSTRSFTDLGMLLISESRESKVQKIEEPSQVFSHASAEVANVFPLLLQHLGHVSIVGLLWRVTSLCPCIKKCPSVPNPSLSDSEWFSFKAVQALSSLCPICRSNFLKIQTLLYGALDNSEAIRDFLINLYEVDTEAFQGLIFGGSQTYVYNNPNCGFGFF
jgi:hypothetical protein